MIYFLFLEQLNFRYNLIAKTAWLSEQHRYPTDQFFSV
ncbi:hypothetical protein YPPY34_2283 [Yersinia pestis PY-34]|nr:hypothetical protein YPPY34_2283 [Yersinia pestis PY-34]EIS95996.1 hypothetical protein YPPY89_2486 [Yersinia pestis PY-89]